jgi:DNA segregation ATPase FtsK/SpoIIIE-like protein
MRDILDRQAGAIEYVLHTHGIQAQVDGGKLSPRLAHFHLVLPRGVNPARLAPFAPDIAEAIGVVSCRLARGDTGEDAVIEVPRPDPVPVRLLPLVRRVADVIPPATATLGLDSESTPLLLRLNSPEVNPVMLCGTQGAGKSSLLRGMALSLALHNSPESLSLLLIDCTGDGVAFRGLENLPHLPCPIANGPVDALVGLRWALRALARRTHMADRDELFFEDALEEFGEDEPLFEMAPAQAAEPDLVILLDGADRLAYTGDKRADAQAADSLRRIIASGARHGVYVVASAERPGGIVGASPSWGARIVGRVHSQDDARLGTGVKGSGAHELLGSGDFLVNLNNEIIRFQAAGVSASEVERAVDLIRTCAPLSQPRPTGLSTELETEGPPRPAAPARETRRLDYGQISPSAPAASPGPDARKRMPPQQPVPFKREWKVE